MADSLNELLKENEIFLKDNLFIGGEQPNYEDAKFFKLLIDNKYKPDQKIFPSVWAWYSIMILFEDEIIKEWLRHPVKTVKNKIKNKIPSEQYILDVPDNYDINLDYKDKIEEQRNKHKDEVSIVFLEIKPDNADMDLNILAKKIMKDIKRQGLVWNDKYEIKEFAFGVKILLLGMYVKTYTSVQDIIDQLETWEEDIQSVDYALFTQC